MLFALTVTSEYALLGNSINISLLAARLPDYLPTLAFTFFLGGGNEEPGWRGYALPHLQTRFGPIRGTLLLGVAWALWHLPLLAASPGATHSLASFTDLVVMTLVTLLSINLYSFWYTWLYNRTRSVLLCMLLHAGFNASNGIFILLPENAVQGAIYQTLLLLSAGTLLILVAVLVTVTHGRLGQKTNGYGC